MTPENQRIAIAEECGLHPEHSEEWGWIDQIGCAIPHYTSDMNAIYQANEQIGLHNRENVSLRVSWVAHLRTVVSRRCPVNKVGSPVVSDLDLLAASAAELAEAFLRTIKKWKP